MGDPHRRWRQRRRSRAGRLRAAAVCFLPQLESAAAAQGAHRHERQVRAYAVWQAFTYMRDQYMCLGVDGCMNWWMCSGAEGQPSSLNDWSWMEMLKQAGGAEFLLATAAALCRSIQDCTRTQAPMIISPLPAPSSPLPPCRAVREAFGEAYDEQAAARAGKRQKRAGGISAAAAAAAAANDPTRARVEGILAASAQPVAAPAGGGAAAGGGQEDVMQEQI